jgi:outer membrane usher protein
MPLGMVSEPMYANSPLPPSRRPLRRGCSMLCLAGCLTGAEVGASEAQFDSSFLRSFGPSDPSLALDLSALDSRSGLAPGTYEVNVRLNGTRLGRRALRLFSDTDGAELRACLSAELLAALDVVLRAQPEQACIDLPSAIEGADQHFDGSTLTLALSIPQAALKRQARGFVDEREWDSGIDAAMLNYQFSAARGQRRHQPNTYQGNLYLQAGANVAGWRLRTHSALSQGRDARRQWQRSNAYAQRDLARQWGTLTLGEYFTPGNVFDSVPYRGVQISSDMAMLPDSQQGYAPVVRGIADSEARVEVRQNGYSLYSTFVPPGPFVIDDLSAAGGSGELEVIVTEADGRERRYVQPYATLSNMLRQGVWRHSLTLGQYHSGDDQASPAFAEATLAYGLPLDLTLYGGLQASGFYQALQAGLGTSLGAVGALSLDVTQAYTDHPGLARDVGQSYGWRYGKSFASGTSLRFAGYRYSTEGYRDFGEAVWQQDSRQTPLGGKRNRLEASLAQATPYGSVFFNVNQQTYWHQRAREQQVQLGLSTYYKGITYGLYGSRTLNGDSRRNDQLSLTLSLPLGETSSATYSVASGSQGGLEQRGSLAGQVGGQRHWRYGLNVGREPVGGPTGSASLNYRSPSTQFGGVVSLGDHYRQVTLNATGSLLAHADGVEFGHSLGETIALVDTRGIAGVGVQNAPGTRTNGRGYSLVPYLTPYRYNRIALDTDHLGLDIDVENGVSQAIPRRGAVIKTRFNISRSRKIIAQLRMADGKLPPFGSQVLDGNGNVVGVLGPGGQVLLAVAAGDTRLIARWNPLAQGQCAFELAPTPDLAEAGYSTQALHCQPVADLAAGPSALPQRVNEATL